MSRKRRSSNQNVPMHFKRDNTSKTKVDQLTELHKVQESDVTIAKYEQLLKIHNSSRMVSQASSVQLSTVEYFRKLRFLRDNFITNSIYDIIKNEIFSSSIDNGITVTMDNKKLEREANKFIQSPIIIDFIKSSLPDLLHYGSFIISPATQKGKGIISLSDEYEPGDVMEILDSSGKPLCYFVNPITPDALGSTLRTNMFDVNRILDPSDLIYLSLNLNTKKLYMGEDAVEKWNSHDHNIEKFDKLVKIRVSSSILDGNISKLEDLLLLDKITISKDIANLLSPTVVGVPLPASNSLSDMVNIINKLEEVVNGRDFSVQKVLTGETDIEEISRVKFVPISDGKGQPQTLDTARNENSIDFDKFRNHLELFLQSIGIPPDLVLGSTTDNMSKIYVRYSKLIKRIASVYISLIRKILIIHFSNRYPKFKFKSRHFDVSIRTNSNLDILEYTEAQELHLASSRSFMSVIEDLQPLTQNSSYRLDQDLLIEKFDNMLAEVGSAFAGVFVKTSEEGEAIDLDDGIEDDILYDTYNDSVVDEDEVEDNVEEGAAVLNLMYTMVDKNNDRYKTRNTTGNK